MIPDVVLMDLQFGHANSGGADATRRIRALDAAPYVLVLTNYDSDGDILGAVEAGASGIPAQGCSASRAHHCRPRSRGRESALAPVIATRLMDRMRAPQASMSARELQVLELVAAGCSNSDITAELFVSDTTVKSHLAHIFTKLGVSSRTAAVSRARERDILR